jgi:small subunit ribosomal protein S21
MSVAEVRLQEGESVENALRRFKRKVQAENIIGEVKRHSYYLEPGEKRRLKQALARKRPKKVSQRVRVKLQTFCGTHSDHPRDCATSQCLSNGQIMCFYEKVIKVKADVAASLVCFPTLA